MQNNCKENLSCSITTRCDVDLVTPKTPRIQNDTYFEYTGKKILTRLAPSNLIKWYGQLNKAQEQSIIDMGFGSLLNLKVENIPTSLAFWLLQNYNHQTNTINVADDVNVHITPELVHELIGIPMGTIEINDKRPDDKDPVVAEWRLQYKDTEWIKRPYVMEFFERVSKMKDSKRKFKLNFLVGVFTVLGETNGNSVVNQRFLSSVIKEVNTDDFNWCAYMIKCLNRCKTKWKPTKHFNGSVLLLAVKIKLHLTILKRQ